MAASQRTAALAGAWAGFGVASVQAWLDHHASMSTVSQDVLWLATFLVFLAMPAYLFGLGRGAQPFRRELLPDHEARSRQAALSKRLFIWFVCAGLVGVLWSLVLMAAAG